MARFICSLLIVLSFSSCQIYKSNFECTPGKGVPCTPVTTIEQMIVETPEGNPDIFLGYLPSQTQECVKFCPGSKALQHRKVWITGKEQPDGLYVEGHYIYLKKKEMADD